jgi:hypothetical protein
MSWDEFTYQEQVVQCTTARQRGQRHIGLSTDDGTCGTKVVLAIREATCVQSEECQLKVLLGPGPTLLYRQHVLV